MAMEFPTIDDAKLRSAGSVLLVKHEGTLQILLGKRNKPGKTEHETFSIFHGNIIRNHWRFDEDALGACKRNLVWEMTLLEGDPKSVSRTIRDDKNPYREEQERVLAFINGLRPVGILKNRDWENNQRPNFVFVVDYESVEPYINNFEKFKSKKQWRPEMSELKLFDVHELVGAIENQVELEDDPVNLIPFNKHMMHGSYHLYDAFTRTIAVSMKDFKDILLANS